MTAHLNHPQPQIPGMMSSKDQFGIFSYISYLASHQDMHHQGGSRSVSKMTAHLNHPQPQIPGMMSSKDQFCHVVLQANSKDKHLELKTEKAKTFELKYEE